MVVRAGDLRRRGDRLDRAFDSWPAWYQVRHASQGPSLDDLAWEMGQRDPLWQPAWASLLPSA